MYSRREWVEFILCLIAVFLVIFLFLKTPTKIAMSEIEISTALNIIKKNGYQCEKLVYSNNLHPTGGWQIECTNARYSLVPDYVPGIPTTGPLKLEVAEL